MIVATPLRVARWATVTARTLHALGRFNPVPNVPKVGGSDIADAVMRRLDPSMPAYPIKAFVSTSVRIPRRPMTRVANVTTGIECPS